MGESTARDSLERAYIGPAEHHYEIFAGGACLELKERKNRTGTLHNDHQNVMPCPA